MADPSEDNNNPGEGTADDFSTWDWHKIMTAIVGYYGSGADTGLSNPSTLYTAANTLEYVKNTLQMVAQSIKDQADALSYGDDAPWKGQAAEAFNTLMYQLGQNIKANAQVLVGDVASDNIPNQVYANGQRLETAINTIHAIDHWYAQQAIARGVSVKDGLVMVHEDQQVVDAMTRDMRTVITNLSNHYSVTNDGFQAPSTDDNPGPNGGNNNPFGNGDNNPFGDGNNNPFGDNNPFGGNNDPGGSGDGGGGGSNFTPPPVKDFNLPGDGGGDGGGAGGGGGGSDFTPPPVSNFPGGGGDNADLTNFPGGGNGPSDLSNFPGGNGDSGPGGLNDPSNLTPPPVSNFPGLGGDNGTNGGANDGSNLGDQNFTPPPVSNFPGLGNLGGNGNLGDLGGSNGGLNNLNSDLFNDKGGLDTSSLDNLKPGVSNFPGLGDSGVGGGADGLGGLGGDSGLANNLESSAPPPLSEFPGLGDTTTSGLSGGPNQGQPGSGMPMMPPGMGGMGGAGGQNNNPSKSDASGLLNPIKFPGDLGDNVDPSGLLDGGGGASSGGGGGLSGLDGLDGLKDLEGFPGASGGGGADLPPVAGFPGGTDVSDPALANLGGENGLGVDGFGSDPTGLTTEGLAAAGGGATAGAPGGSPMMPPGMGGMGGAGQQNNNPSKSDASGLLNPTMFPGGVVDNLGDPSVLLSGGAGAAGGSGGLSGLDVPPAFDGGPVPTGVPDNGISVDNPDLPVSETAQQPQQAMPGMPMMPPVGGSQQPNGSRDGERPEASGLLVPDGTAFADHGFVDQPQAGAPSLQSHGQPGGTGHHGAEGEPAAAPDRVAMVHGGDGAEDFTAWDAGGAASAAVLPWLLGRGGKRDEDDDAQTDAPVEDNDKWVQGDLRGLPAPAEQPHLATWRPEKVVGGATPLADAPVLRSSAAMPEPEPEPEADAATEEGEEEPERSSADLLDRRSEQWDSRSSDLPGVLG
jgi:uncharacterized protein YukE